MILIKDNKKDFGHVIVIVLIILFNSQLLFAGNDQELLPLILKNYPAENSDHAEKINRAIFNLGKPAIKSICERLDDSDGTVVVETEFAISSLMDYASQKENMKERKIITHTINDFLLTECSLTTKQFLLAQLALIAADESVDIAAKFLADKHLSDPALKILSAINSEKSKKALLKALESEGTDAKKIVKTLGDLRCKMASAKIQTYLDSDDKDFVLTCAYALSRIGDPETFARAIEKLPVSERDIYRLEYAQRRADLGDQQTALDICRSILAKDCSGNGDCSQQIAALQILVTVAGQEAIADVLKAVDNPDFQLYSSALRILQNFPDDRVVDAIAKKLFSANADGSRKSSLVAILGQLKNKKAMPVIEEMLKDSDETVRITARQALFDLDKNKALTSLFSNLQDTLTLAEQAAVKEILLVLPLYKYQTELSQTMQTASAENKVLLVEIISERNLCALIEDLFSLLNDKNLSVRIAVIRSLTDCITEKHIDPLFEHFLSMESDVEIKSIQSLLAQEIRRNRLQSDYVNRCIRLMEKDKGGVSIHLLALLGKIGSKSAFSYVKKQIHVNDLMIREAAIQAMVNWPDSSAIPVLLNLAQTEKVVKHKVLTLQGAIGLTRSNRFSEQEKLALYKEEMPLTVRVEEKIQLVSAVAELRTPEAMLYLNELLEEPDVAFEAGLAILSVTTPRYREEKVFTGREVAGIWLQSQLDTSAYHQILTYQKNQQQSRWRRSQESESEKKDLYSGILFNGKDLSGWQTINQKDEGTSWGVEDSLLFTAGKGGSWLSTENEYENFKLDLEFRLPPGGNSGVFLRAPHEGDPAYTGMEIQILDDEAGEYAELKSWQYTGSIYAVQAPSKRVTKKAGEWQSMEITCVGPLVQVVLNGEMIVDTDLIKHMDKVGKNPGLKRRKGYIGLQDHSSRVEFRHIRLTELE
jgi:HEAT repeat protein